MNYVIPQYVIPTGVQERTFRNIVSAAYTAYTGYRRIPSVDDIAEFCQHEKRTIAKVLVTDEFKTAIQSRGIPWDGYGGLSTEQHYALTILMNPTDRRALGAKLKSCGITYPIYRAWLKQPKFAEYVRRQSEELLVDHEADFNTVLANRGLNGDLASIKFIYELTGKHNPQNNQIVDAQRVISLLLEVITRHVTDPNVLSQIVADITNVMPGSGSSVPGSVVKQPVGVIAEPKPISFDEDFTL